jgi:hypothetical protein
VALGHPYPAIGECDIYEIVAIAPEDFAQMRFTENDNVIEAIPTYGADEPLYVRACQGLCGAVMISSMPIA